MPNGLDERVWEISDIRKLITTRKEWDDRWEPRNKKPDELFKNVHKSFIIRKWKIIQFVSIERKFAAPHADQTRFILTANLHIAHLNWEKTAPIHSNINDLKGFGSPSQLNASDYYFTEWSVQCLR